VYMIDHMVVVRTQHAVLLYDGTPRQGALIASHAGRPGTDPWGNTYPGAPHISPAAGIWLARYGLDALARSA
jgi:hypothetical protein